MNKLLAISVVLLSLNLYVGCSKESADATIGKDGAITDEDFEKLKKENPDYFKKMEKKED